MHREIIAFCFFLSILKYREKKGLCSNFFEKPSVFTLERGKIR